MNNKSCCEEERLRWGERQRWKERMSVNVSEKKRDRERTKLMNMMNHVLNVEFELFYGSDTILFVLVGCSVKIQMSNYEM